MELKTKSVTRQYQDIKLVKDLLCSAFPKREWH